MGPDSPFDARSWAAINSIRTLAMDAVEQAASGHPGTPMALAPAAFVLWTRHLRHAPTEPEWADRDRFVLSCGHASMLLYSLLHLSGYDVSLDDIRSFRQWGSKTAGHPERSPAYGVETTTGPLGQGVGNAVGMAMAERLLAERFNRSGHEIVSHRTWAFVSDGDMMEGVASEAASLAGHLRLAKLTLLYDDNRITIDGETSLAFSEDVGRRYEAYGWHVERVDDGNDLDAIDRALEAARAEADRPSLVVLRTVIADPAPTKRGTSETHGAPLGKEEVARTKAGLGWPPEPFLVPGEARELMGECVGRGAALAGDWAARLEAYRGAHPDLAAELDRRLAGSIDVDWEAVLPAFGPADAMATRQASSATLHALVRALPELVGGSADLATSTGVFLKGATRFSASLTGPSIAWGVREHAMAAALNGLAAHGGVRPYGATFLVFADYMKPAIRLAAMMHLPVIYVFSHDSIGVGEDGPTHQPVEHLAMLRSIPNLVVLRPADAAETAQAWRAALERHDGPVALILTRQKVPALDRSQGGDATRVRQGGYVLFDPPAATPAAIVIATGSEVQHALATARTLSGSGLPTRVVSLPSWELFAAQPRAYRDQVLPPAIRARVSVEAATTFGWRGWVTDAGETLGIDHFGASAPAERLFREFGFVPDRIAEAVRRVHARTR
jgi:transketolase